MGKNKKRKNKKHGSSPTGVDRTKSGPTRKNPKTPHQINKEIHSGKQAVGYQEWLDSFKKLDLGPVRRK